MNSAASITDHDRPDRAGLHRAATAFPTQEGRARPGPLLAALAAAAVVVLVAAVVSAVPSDRSGAEPDQITAGHLGGAPHPEVVINGGGWGHGRGMSQYGAQGYATNFGWTSAQILNHYYGGTTAGQAPSPGEVDPNNVRVDLVSMRGRATTVALDDGTLHLMTADGATLQRVTGAARLTAVGGAMTVETAPSCDGPWTVQPSIDRTLVRIEAETTASGQSGLLNVCGPSYRTWYDGEIWATAAGVGQRTINLVSIEQYLRGVVPNEMPASWDPQALQAQAVAARSYALAGDTRWSGYADTCDTTLCQVYDGRFTTRGGLRAASHPNTDAAIAATAGLVRLTGGGAVARTEFSSSSGGYTAGGDFPAVIDEGDSVSTNANHQWQQTVDLVGVEEESGLGLLQGVTVSERNGFGPDGGRAVTVTYHFEDGTTSVSGDDFRRRFGLKSNLFSFGSFSRGGVEQSSLDPQDIAIYVNLAFERLNGRAPTAEEAVRWRAAVAEGGRISLARELVAGDHFAGVLVDDLYRSALDRAADPSGRRYWVATMADGLRYEHLGTLFFGSPEYYRRAGGTDQTFVTSLYRNILDRQPDAGGMQYWLSQLGNDRATSADVANAFFRSVESRRNRSREMYQRVILGQPNSAEVERYADRLLTIDDLALAAELAASPDFVDSP